MITKTKEKTQAIKLRKQGLSYREILRRVPVAKSTLSLWLRNIGLSKRQKQRLTEKKLLAARRGAESKRQQRLFIVQQIKEQAMKGVGRLNRREFWLIGVALYWAEGSKQKDHSVSVGTIFGNSDPLMIKFFYKWIVEICKINPKDICFELFIHKSSNIKKSQKYWSKILNLPFKQFNIVRIKKHNLTTKRKNVGDNYHGLLRIRIRRSTNLNRKIAGWIEGICKCWGVV